MGLMRFIVSPADCLTENMVDQAYLCSFDRVPWQARVSWDNGELRIERRTSDSASLHIPWRVEGYDLLTLSTGTLIERPEPYYLPLELARGKIAQTRNQLSDWQSAGLIVPAEAVSSLTEAIRLLSLAAVGDRADPRSVASASRALRLALDASYQLTSAYTEQVLAIRRRAVGKLNTFLGADLGLSVLDEYLAGQYLQTFNAARVPMIWREIESHEGKYSWDVVDQQIAWCRENRLTVCAGPLLQLDGRTVPDWLYLCEGDFDGLVDFVSEYVEAVVRRYQGKVDLWIAAGRVNTADALSLTEEENVRLTARAVELVRSLDDEPDILISFDQPWAEYLRQRSHDFPPMQFADALLRAGLGLKGLALELNVDYVPGGTLPRDPMEFSRQIDYWALLGVPLYVMLTAPSGVQPDPLAQQRATPLSGMWSSGSQQTWANRYTSLLVSKPSVRGVFWSQLRDSEPHPFPHGGLFDLRRHPKPALRQLASIRQAHLR